MVAMYRAYLPARQDSDELAAFIEALDESSWSRLVDDIPEGIAEREPLEFGRWRGVSAADLESRIRG